ncbi:MAG: DUF1499 domain-containing protein [Sedimenticola selenatireducens]|uniref:DUF1499 domain-containing protein n=2 Tax=Sedimenticola selenatireducens TaxID=191960 RepID=A0A557SKT3_9GAMM|nr:DUF1499 domain-containing protein [Sedimenticola selenatireducens]TVT65238.1 MAG: DUF1499 domain-containing protein [Sedimenticola selenatireducens]
MRAKVAGLTDGILSQCPDKANCVCSEHMNDSRHYVEPISFTQNSPAYTLSLLHEVIQELGGTVQATSENYLAATFTSAIFRFVDDLEVRLDLADNVIHIRSASRVGYSDLGVNKKRVESLRALFNTKLVGQ